VHRKALVNGVRAGLLNPIKFILFTLFYNWQNFFSGEKYLFLEKNILRKNILCRAKKIFFREKTLIIVLINLICEKII
jgi:hypothetical protein